MSEYKYDNLEEKVSMSRSSRQRDQKWKKKPQAARKSAGVKKRERNDKKKRNNRALGDVLAAEEEKLQGLQDGGMDFEEKIERTYTVNKWALVTNQSTKNFRWKEISDTLVSIDGYFKIGGGLVYLKGSYPYYEGRPVLAASRCTTIIVVEVGSHPVNVVPDYLALDLTRDTLYRRVFRACVSNLPYYYDKLNHSPVKFRNRVKATVKRYGEDFSLIEDFITIAINSEEFQQKLDVDFDADKFITTAHRKIVRYCQQHGKLVSQVLEPTEPYTTSFRFFLSIIGYACSMYTEMFTLIAVLHASYHIWNMYWHRTNDKSDLERYRDALKFIERDNGLDQFAILPCARVTLESQVFDNDRLSGYRFNGASLSTNYDVVSQEDYQPNEVDVYGVTTLLPKIYPDNGPQNLEAALDIRMLFERHPDEEKLGDFQRFARRLIDELPSMQINEDDEEVEKHLVSTYGQRRAAELMRIRHDDLVDKDFDCDIFVKKELYLGKTSDDFKPRQIWCRKDIILAKFSYLFSKVGKHLKHLFNGEHAWYVSGAKPSDVGAFGQMMDNDYDYLIEGDVSNWDGSMLHEFLDLELYFLDKCIDSNNPDLEILKSHWFDMRGYSRDGEVVVEMNHGRKSGDLWTSSFNSLLNVLFTMYVYDWDWNSDFKMMVLGDDNLVAFNSGSKEVPSVDQITQTYADLGMKIELISRDSILESEFCSGNFWIVDGDVVWGNKIFRTLSKIGVNHHNHPEHMFRSLLHGTAKGMLCTAGHVPILGAFFRAILDTAEDNGIKARTDNRHRNPYRFQGGRCLYPAADTYNQCAAMYGVDVEIILELEDWIEHNITILDCPYIITDDLLTSMGLVEFGKDDDAQLDDRVRIEESFKSADPYIQITEEIPRLEEVEKLKGMETFAEAFNNAYNFGYHEYQLTGHYSHIFLHCLFTTFSWICLDWGVKMHSRYNQLAMRGNGRLFPCSRTEAQRAARRRRRRRKRQRQTIPSKRLEKEKREVEQIVDNERSLLRKIVQSSAGLASKHFFGDSGIGSGMAGAALDFFGVGDFRVNSLIREGNLPRVNPRHNNSRSYRLKGTEYVDILKSNTGTVFDYYSINPMNAALFPKLSVEAQMWEMYRFHGLVVSYIPSAGMVVSGTNPNLGVVAMATQRDVLDSEFVSDHELLSYEGASLGRTCDEIIHGVECDMADLPFKWYYCDELSEENRTSEFGRLTVMTDGQPADDDVIGRLFVSYDIEFDTRKMKNGDMSRQLIWRCSNTSGITAAEPLGSLSSRYIISNFPVSVTDTGAGEGDIIVFPSDMSNGTFLVVYTAFGDSTASTSITLGDPNNSWSFKDGWFGEDRSDTQGIATTSAATTTLIHASVIDLTDNNARISLTSVTLPANATRMSMFILSVDRDDEWAESGPLTTLAPFLHKKTLKLSKEARFVEEEEKFDEFELDSEFASYAAWKSSQGRF